MYLILKKNLFAIFAMLICFNNINASTFVSLKSSEINLRVGPGKEYPISWLLMRANLPMMLIAEFDQWRKIKFIDNTEGWVHKNMISTKNMAIITADFAVMYKHGSQTHPIARVEKNVIVRVLKKEGEWLKVEINNFKGWVERKYIWGVNEAD